MTSRQDTLLNILQNTKESKGLTWQEVRARCRWHAQPETNERLLRSFSDCDWLFLLLQAVTIAERKFLLCDLQVID
jgi:hypothetical protein